MKISHDEVRHVAQLARLNLDETTVMRYAEQIGQVLSYIDKLNEVDTSGVKPASAVQIVNAFREDEVRPSLSIKEVLANAPQASANEFIVPKVVG